MLISLESIDNPTSVTEKLAVVLHPVRSVE